MCLIHAPRTTKSCKNLERHKFKLLLVLSHSSGRYAGNDGGMVRMFTFHIPLPPAQFAFVAAVLPLTVCRSICDCVSKQNTGNKRFPFFFRCFPAFHYWTFISISPEVWSGHPGPGADSLIDISYNI